MNTFIVQEGQTILDVSLQVYGNLDNLVKLLVDNNIDANVDLKGGDTILYDVDLSNLSSIPNQLQLNKVFLNTGSILLVNTQEPLPEMLEHNAADYSNEEHN